VTFVGYGLSYFDRLPGGRAGSLVARYMPRLASDASRYVLEEAQPSPTDVSPDNPGITKLRYNLDVRIERSDILFTLRSDNSGTLSDVLAWFAGSKKLRGHAVASPAWGGLIRFTSSRHMFVQMGLPKAVARRRRTHRAGHRHDRPRAPDGSPLLPPAQLPGGRRHACYIRMDGPGFDAMDVPGGGRLPKLQFTIFVPSSEFFRTLRTSQASLDLQDKYGVSVEDNGIERFLTATRRQNFLVPPRRHCAFPLTELA